MRALVRLLTVVALVATGLLLPTTGTSPSTTASAADLRFFDPGNIISDAVFFDAFSTDVGTVQAFINVKGAKCVAGEAPCLKDYSQPTADQPGDAYCSTYRGAPNGESAASIIVKVGQACGINPRALLVLLQKEQGLVTGSKRAASAYTNATGFACPDTSPCNPAFSGFASQVYFAARQFQRYAAGVAGSYRAGKANTVRYSPDVNCGSSQVLIQNKATAGLYSYTPYQPNAAALAAGYGEGDNCSAYGNRNFWNYFTDWFGSTQSPGGSAIYAEYQETGAASGPLGAISSTFMCGYRDGGCFQAFQGGSIYWTRGTGAHALYGEIRKKWAALGWENSTLGYPVGDETCGLVGGGCLQSFQYGTMYWSSASGATFIRGAIRDLWAVIGGQNSVLGYPTSDEYCGLRDGGCFSKFQNGSVYWTAGLGAHLVASQTLGRWAATGYEGGPLGYPVTNTFCGGPAGGCLQGFQGGVMYWSAATGGWTPTGAVKDLWVAVGAEWGALGYPTSDVNCGLRAGGCFESFQGGSIYWTKNSGAHLVASQVLGSWAARGYENSSLGYPLTNTSCGGPGGGCLQAFEGGVLYWSAGTGGWVPSGAIKNLWVAVGAEWGVLGYPTGDVYCGLRDMGCFEPFQRGSIYSSPATGAHFVDGAIREAWAAAGYENSTWGYPTENPVGTAEGISQRFQRGTATWNATTGTVTFG